MEILRATPEDSRDIVALFKEYRFALHERSWWDWKYFQNPRGAAQPFKLVLDGKLVGAVAIMPQSYIHKGRRVVGIQPVDGLMGREIRGKHLFNDVMSFVLSERPKGVERDFFYLSFFSLPSVAQALQNAGWKRHANGTAYSFHLSSKSLLKNQRIAWLRPVMRPLFGLYRYLLFWGASPDVRIEEIERFTDDVIPRFDDHKVRGERSAEILNWRVMDNPRIRMRAFSVYRGRELAGCFICKVVEGDLEIVDCLFPLPHSTYLVTFLKYVYAKGLADSAYLLLLGNNSNRALLPRRLCLRRPFTGAMFVYGLDTAALPTDPDLWEVSYLDSDW